MATTFPFSSSLKPSSAEDFEQIVRFMRLDRDHLVFRKFERLSLYNLLYQQHQLALLDSQIGECERQNNPEGLATILPAVGPLFKAYGESLLLQKKLLEIPDTRGRSVSYLKEYCDHHLIELRNELDIEDGWSDLASLASIQKGWIHKLVDNNANLQRLFRKRGNDNEKLGVLLYSEDKLARVEEIILNLGFSLLVVGPIFALSYTERKLVKLLLVCFSIFAASGTSALIPGMSQFNVLALVVGYTAILVVFLSADTGN